MASCENCGREMAPIEAAHYFTCARCSKRRGGQFVVPTVNQDGAEGIGRTGRVPVAVDMPEEDDDDLDHQSPLETEERLA